MEAKNRFAFLRKVLGAIGLSPEATDDFIDRISDFLSDKGRSQNEKQSAMDLPEKFAIPNEKYIVMWVV